MRATHTYAVLDVSEAAYTEIADKLKAAGYDHAFDNGVIDMHGIALALEPKPAAVPQPPAGYTKLAAGVRCRCARLWTDGKDQWCCGAVSGLYHGLHRR